MPRGRSKPPDGDVGNDVVLIHGVDKESASYHVLRQRENRVEAGTLHPLEHGKALRGEVVSLTQRPEFPLLFDVNVEHGTSVPEESSEPPDLDKESSPVEARAADSARAGPAQVASLQYRKGWDAIWGLGPSRKQTLN